MKLATSCLLSLQYYGGSKGLVFRQGRSIKVILLRSIRYQMTDRARNTYATRNSILFGDLPQFQYFI